MFDFVLIPLDHITYNYNNVYVSSLSGVCHISGWGDPHYRQCDGTKFDYMGECQYILVREIVPEGQQPTFTIVVQNEKYVINPRAAVTKELHIFVYDLVSVDFYSFYILIVVLPWCPGWAIQTGICYPDRN